MPEIPEVEAFKKYVELHGLHKIITQVGCTDTRVIKTPFKAFQKTLVTNSFIKAERRGKFLIIDLKHTDNKVVMHFGLTGYLTYTKDSKEKVKFSVVMFAFKDGSVLHWNSVRKFGKLWLVPSLDAIKELADIGPDALKITQQQFVALAEKNKAKSSLFWEFWCSYTVGYHFYCS